jgi:arylsulfatase A-like enzyme
MLIFTACQPDEKTQQWNILFILADDLGWNQVGYHGVEFYETGNIDKIAAEGIYFTNAYASDPVCSPTRAGIMTGKHPARLHLTDYIPGSPYPFARLSTPQQIDALPPEEVTIAEKLREGGYITGHFGKWHLSPDKNYLEGRPHDPGAQGFDVVLTTVKPEDDADPEKDAHHTIEITDHALDFIEKNKDKPFFCYVAYHTVHRPLHEKADLIAKYAKKPGSDLPVNNPVMGAMIERMDTGIGQLIQKLADLHLTDKTVVIFYSDNGGFEQLQDQAPLRGGKAMVFEGGIRVPLAIKWPEVISPGRTSDALVASEDFFPTIMELTGINYSKENLDGYSLLPILQGTGTNDRTALFFHYPHYHHLGYLPGGAIREGDYKLIEWFEETLTDSGTQINLFEVSTDIGEEKDLAIDMPEKAAEMRKNLQEWRKRVKAQEMTLNPAYDPKKADWRFELGEN